MNSSWTGPRDSRDARNQAAAILSRVRAHTVARIAPDLDCPLALGGVAARALAEDIKQKYRGDSAVGDLLHVVAMQTCFVHPSSPGNSRRSSGIYADVSSARRNLRRRNCAPFHWRAARGGHPWCPFSVVNVHHSDVVSAESTMRTPATLFRASSSASRRVRDRVRRAALPEWSVRALAWVLSHKSKAAQASIRCRYSDGLGT